MIKLLIFKIIIIAELLTFCLTASARVFYIAPDGNDLTGNGSISMPWKSLSTACSQVKTQGDTIYVKAGLYNETITSRLAVGVSLIGEGNSSIITSTSITDEWKPIIDMTSALLINGDQTISHLQFDGKLTAAMALDIRKRNNVKIHHCTFLDLYYSAVYWVGDGGHSGGDPYTDAYPPTNYVTGSEFHDNIVNNCAFYSYFGYGALYIGGHDGMLIYNNTLTQTQRASGQNGYPIKIFGNGGWMRGMKIFNNTIAVNGNEWLFAIEGFFCMGAEIYNNTITGAIDINFSWKDTYDYGLYIHDNTLGPETITSTQYRGIILEFRVEDTWIKRNRFRNLGEGIYHTMRNPYPWVKRERIHCNLFAPCGGGANHSILRYGETQNNFTIEDLEFYNNTCVSDKSDPLLFGLHIRGFLTATDIKIRNNIFVNFSWYWFESNRGNYFTNLYIQNNILYNNANSNSVLLNGTPTNYANSGNITASPNFYSELNFHLKKGSVAIGAGTYIPELYDLDGIQVGNPPSAGCYQTIADQAIPTYLSSVIENANPKLLIITYDLPLQKIVPYKSAFEVNVNSQVSGIASIEVIDGKVHIILEEPVNFGDDITITYTIPSINPLQSVTNMVAAGINNLPVINNVKTESTENSLSISINPNPILEDSFTVKIEGDIPVAATIFRIYRLNGAVMFEKLFDPGMLNDLIYINIKLGAGLYIARLSSVSTTLGTRKLIVVR